MITNFFQIFTQIKSCQTFIIGLTKLTSQKHDLMVIKDYMLWNIRAYNWENDV